MKHILDPIVMLKGLYKSQLGDHEFVIERQHIVEVCEKLRSEGFEHLSLITAVDWKTRWEVLYHLVRFGEKDVLVLRVTLPYKTPEIPSVTSVWPGAGWHERETYDLMGITFTGNDDLRRILLPEDFDLHPLRKEVKYGNLS